LTSIPKDLEKENGQRKDIEKENGQRKDLEKERMHIHSDFVKSDNETSIWCKRVGKSCIY
jgi:hypothetical protein